MLIVSKLRELILVVLFSLVGLTNTCSSATNIALGKQYSISVKPNYALSAPSHDLTSLTDGKYTTGHFWTHKSTVGWQKSGPVEIIIDLEKVFTIESISFNTARSKAAGVEYPARVSTFIGPDKSHLLYVGDIVANPDNLPGSYQVKKFILHDLNVKGRYVVLEIDPKGPFLFCDEIEVHEGARDKGTLGNSTIDEARKLAGDHKKVSIDKELLAGLVGELKPLVSSLPQIFDRLESISDRIKSATLSAASMEVIEADILSTRGALLRSIHPEKDLIVTSVNPWSPVSLVSPLQETADTTVSLMTTLDWYDQAAFLVTNLAEDTRQVSFSLAGMAGSICEISLYQLPFLKTAAMKYVADPLLSLKDGISLRSGESRLIMLTSRGRKPGVENGKIKISCGRTEISIPVTCRVTKINQPSKMALNAVNWGYLDFKPVRLSKQEAVKDLFSHHTKAIIIPPRYLALADRPGTAELIRMNKAFELHKGADKILLFMNFRDDKVRTGGGEYMFLSEGWLEWFNRWYVRMITSASAAGFTRDQIYLYPYDEMVGDQIDQFIAFATMIRRKFPEAKLYATLGLKDSERALPFLDVAQVCNDDEVLKKFNSHKTELWLYLADGPAKSLSPYSYYRLMSWKAFLRGYKGVGFWAYADTGWDENPGTAWNDFDGKYPDFSVIYEGPSNSIISSRRWEAWRLGIEDYELLTMYAKARGDRAARDLAASVFNHPEDTKMADKVRRQIMIDLEH